jgi:hypothetical protein
VVLFDNPLKKGIAARGLKVVIGCKESCQGEKSGKDAGGRRRCIEDEAQVVGEVAIVSLRDEDTERFGYLKSILRQWEIARVN